MFRILLAHSQEALHKRHSAALTSSGGKSCTKTECHPLLTHGPAAFGTKRTVSKNLKMFSGSNLA
jgi:hypothetical protein